MSIYNKRVASLPVLNVDPVWAKLKRLDKPGEYEWLVNPAQISYSISNNVSALTVIGRNLPNIAPQNAAYQFSVSVPLITYGNNKDLSDDIKILTEFSTMVGQKLPKLSFEFGSFKIMQCCITALSVSVFQWRSGKPTSAAAQLTILAYEDIKPPQIFKEDVVKQPTIALSAREQARVGEVLKLSEKTHRDVRVNGDNVEGVNRKTGKREIISSLKNIVGITGSTGDATDYGNKRIEYGLETSKPTRVLTVAEQDYFLQIRDQYSDFYKDIRVKGTRIIGVNKSTGKTENLADISTASGNFIPPEGTP